MNKKFLEQLKTKVKAFGFNDEEIEVAVAMLGKLNSNLSNEDLSDEEINSSIEAVIPMFKSAQSHSDKIIRNKDNENKKAVELLNAKIKELEGKKSTTDTKTIAENIPETILKRLEALEEQNKSLSKNVLENQAKELSAQRLSKFRDTLKDADKSWLKSVEKQFSRMTFKDEEDFNSYHEDIAKDSKEYAQHKANEDLLPFAKIKNGANNTEGVREIVSDVMQERLKSNGIEVKQSN